MASPIAPHPPIPRESDPLLGTDQRAISPRSPSPESERDPLLRKLFQARVKSSTLSKPFPRVSLFIEPKYRNPTTVISTQTAVVQDVKDRRSSTVDTVDFTVPGGSTYGPSTTEEYVNPAYSGASTDLGGDVLGAVLGFGKIASTNVDGTPKLSGLVISDTQARIVDLNAAVSAVFGFIEAKTKIDESYEKKCRWFFIEGSTQFVSLILQFSFGIMSGTLAILSLIPDIKIDLSAVTQVALTCSALLCICYAYQAIRNFIYAGQYFHLHANLAYKSLDEKKTYIQSFLKDGANKAYLEKLISTKYLYKAQDGSLDETGFKKLEHALLVNGCLSIVSGLLQSALAILTLYFDLNSGGMSSVAIQGVSIAIDCLIGVNILYDISLVLSGAKDERIPALKNRSHRYTSTGLSLISSITTISLCAVANYATSGVASTAILFVASLIPTITISSYRFAKHYWATYLSAHP